MYKYVSSAVAALSGLVVATSKFVMTARKSWDTGAKMEAKTEPKYSHYPVKSEIREYEREEQRPLRSKETLGRLEKQPHPR